MTTLATAISAATTFTVMFYCLLSPFTPMVVHLQGVPSWRWFFPYHYAPFASDCTDLRDVRADFEPDSEPFSPLQQLMAVIPPDSAHLLPEPLAEVC